MRLGNSFIFISFILLVCSLSVSHCWESFELDLFDLVEEVGQNFYEVFEISKVIIFFFFNLKKYPF
jgi:hypothetical protein